MRITDLLDARSILLDASPKSKSEALDQIVDLMVKSERSMTKKHIESRYMQEKKKVPQESARELQFHTENAMQ